MFLLPSLSAVAVVSVRANGKRAFATYAFLRRRLTTQEQHLKDAAYKRLLAFHVEQSHTSKLLYDDGKEAEREASEQCTREWRWLRENVESTGRARSESWKVDKLSRMVERIVERHEPLAYVLGGSICEKCVAPTLIPRSETEALTEHVSSLILLATQDSSKVEQQHTLRILDMCTGTGCIALLLRHRLIEHLSHSFEARIVAVDKSDAAVTLARRNLVELDSHYSSSAHERIRVDVKQANLFDGEQIDDLIHYHGPFDVVVCNPPYIPLREWRALDQSVKEWEDRDALVGDLQSTDKGQGTDFYRRLVELCQRRDGLLTSRVADLRRLPRIAVEVGHDQAAHVQKVFADAGFADTDVWTDPYGIRRAVLAYE